MNPELDEQAGMSAVFGEEPAPVAASEEPEQIEQTEAQPENVEETPVEAEVTEPEYVKADEYRALQERLERLEAVPDQIRRLDGRYGELHRAQQQMQTPKVQLSPEKFKRLSENFPELAEALAGDLSEALSPQQAAPVSPQFDPSQFEQVVNQRVSQATEGLNRQIQVLNLATRHNDWREVSASEGFQQWASKQPDDVRNALANSWDADFIAQQLSAYKSTIKQTAELPAVSAKTKIIQAAVKPVGSRSAMPATDSEADAFLRAARGG